MITGIAKGKRLKSPPESTRPITDRVKESLFSIVGAQIVDANVLDLFAGSGSVGIEALSQGALHSTFVEIDGKALQTLRDNLRLTDLASRATVVRSNVFKFLKQSALPLYDFVYVAPPQYKEIWIDTLQALDSRDILTPDGQVVVQIHPKEFHELDLLSYELSDRRRYGSTLLCFYARKK